MTDPEEGWSLGQSLLGTGRVARSAGWGTPARLHPILLGLRPSHLLRFGPALAHIFMTDPEEGRSLGNPSSERGGWREAPGGVLRPRLHPILLGLRPSHLPGFGPALAHIFMTDPEEGRSLGQSLLGTGRAARSAGWGLPAKAPPHPARPAAEPPSRFRGRIDASYLARSKRCAEAVGPAGRRDWVVLLSGLWWSGVLADLSDASAASPPGALTRGTCIERSRPVASPRLSLPARLPLDLRARSGGARFPHHRPPLWRGRQQLHGGRHLRQGGALCRAGPPPGPADPVPLHPHRPERARASSRRSAWDEALDRASPSNLLDVEAAARAPRRSGPISTPAPWAS